MNDADFRQALFAGYASFIDAEFDKNADWRGDRFLGAARFNSVKFLGETYFNMAQFADHAEFIDVQFAGPVYLWNVQFEGLTDFWNSKFNKKADFEGSQFKEDANLQRTSFGEDSNFRDVFFGKNVSLFDARLGNAYFEGNVTLNNLNLSRAKYDRIFLPWSRIGKLDFDEGSYLLLIKNYNNLGWYKDYNDCYYDYRKDAQNKELENRDFLHWLFDFLSCISFGYGVKPERPLILSAFLIISFGLIFRKGNATLKFIKKDIFEKVTQEEVRVNTSLTKERPTFRDHFMFSFTTFTSGFTSFLHPSIEYKLLDKYTRLAILEKLLGSTLIALFIASIGRIYFVR